MAKHGPEREHQFQSINRTKTSQTGSTIADNDGTGGVSIFLYSLLQMSCNMQKRGKGTWYLLDSIRVRIDGNPFLTVATISPLLREPFPKGMPNSIYTYTGIG